MNEADLEEMEQKTYKEFMQDGFTEIFVGIFLVGMGSLFAVERTIVFIMLFAVIFFPRIMERLKRRYTYPRIGYAKLHVDPPKKTARGIFSYILVVIVAMAVALFIIFGDISVDLWYRWSPTLMGAMMTGAFIYLAGKTGDSRYYGIAVFGLAAGVVLSTYGFDSMWTGHTVYLLFMGFLFIGLGMVQFAYFLSKYPLQEEVANE